MGTVRWEGRCWTEHHHKKSANFKAFQNLAHSSSVVISYWIFHNFSTKSCHIDLLCEKNIFFFWGFFSEGQELRKFCFLFLVFCLPTRSFVPFTTPSSSMSLPFTAKSPTPAKLFHLLKDSTPFPCSKAYWSSTLIWPEPHALSCPASHLLIVGLKKSREDAF